MWEAQTGVEAEKVWEAQTEVEAKKGGDTHQKGGGGR